jgi:hypothetical protein
MPAGLCPEAVQPLSFSAREEESKEFDGRPPSC